jgi:DNA polymerase I-like protein with 3'-5' exonuclease and polymerase domains
VHDEIVAASPNETATDAEKYVIQCMTTPPVWAQDLPIACESGMADNYGDT